MIGILGKWVGKKGGMAAMAAVVLSMASAPAWAQIHSIDPNSAIDADLAPLGGSQSVPDYPASSAPAQPAYGSASPSYPSTSSPASSATTPATPNSNTSYQHDDVVGAAEGVFGKGAEGLAGIIEKILKDQGEPNAYIAGREASGAFVVGLRYGSGTLNHKVEGQREVYWTGPSVGFDVGGNASKVFVLVYNLYDSQDLYRRYPAVEGTAYIVGGFTATYLRRGNVVLIPIRLGVGWRLGVNAGYMKFTEKSRILPF